MNGRLSWRTVKRPNTNEEQHTTASGGDNASDWSSFSPNVTIGEQRLLVNWVAPEVKDEVLSIEGLHEL